MAKTLVFVLISANASWLPVDPRGTKKAIFVKPPFFAGRGAGCKYQEQLATPIWHASETQTHLHQYGSIPCEGMVVSLDHSMWFHDLSDFRADDWNLFEIRCVSAGDSRALTFLKVWTRTGKLVLSCSQELLMRMRKPLAPAITSGNGSSRL